MTSDAERAATPSFHRRLHALDALRGVAAFAVVMHHALLSLPAADALPATVHASAVLRIVELGRPAVMLFFVLSGFALTLCLEATRATFVGFAVRRAFRLLPPYWVAMLASYVAYRLFRQDRADAFSSWSNSQWGEPISVLDLARHVAMLAGPRQFPLDHVAWSLVHEMRLSLVVPLLVALAVRGGAFVCVGFGAAAFCAAGAVFAAAPGAFPTGIHGFRFDAAPLAASLVLSARYVLPFALGVVLARGRDTTATHLAKSRGAAALGLLASITLLSQKDEALMLIGSAGLVTIVTGSIDCARALACAPLVWLGRVSYSLYLVHLPIMLACGHALAGLLAPRPILAIAVVLALAISELMYRSVERPSIALSRTAGRAADAYAQGFAGSPRLQTSWMPRK